MLPVSWLKPSARQTQLVALREKARRLGVKVSVLPLKIDDHTRLEGAAYRWMRQPDALPLLSFWRWMRVEVAREVGQFGAPWIEGWILQQGETKSLTSEQQAALAHWMTQLPAGVFAIEWGSHALAIWWDERPESDQLESWAEQVPELMALPPLAVPKPKVAQSRVW
ncbi:hypothetical protein V6U78_10640 [Marinospirillum sp. MEB164]|uniref:Uncharacterized protein n=1 Tax=Marinospirillum alkalitolerans TaxID=3123374 RepID=A0ABW8Q0A4_9GAMM